MRAASGRWWNTAGHNDIARAWTTAHQWREESPTAEKAAQRLTEEIHRRYGLDLTDAVETGDLDIDQVREAIDAAAWQQAAAKFDNAAIDAALQETETRQRTERDALYDLVADHHAATTEYIAHQDHYIAEPGEPTAARQHRADAVNAADARLRDLGAPGDRWLRQFYGDPHRAYATVLVGPNRGDGAALYTAVQQLHDTFVATTEPWPRPY